MTTGISAASLVLALLIMIRDRQKEQRHQVEAVGTWTVLDETSMTVTLHVCNTNPLPIFAVDIVVGLMWNDRDIERPPWAPSVLYDRYAMWQSRRTTHWDDERTFHWSAIAPEAKIEESYTVPAPDSPPTQPLATVRRLSLVDTGGRRWLVHPGRAIAPKVIGRIHPF